MRRALCAGAVLIAAALTHPAQAQTATTHYAAGWNMTTAMGMEDIDSPVPAGYRYGYDSGTGQYVNLNLPIMFSACAGVWSYFSAAFDAAPVWTELSRAATLDCGSTQPGWYMVGDPFPYPAALPAGVTGFYWDTKTLAYQVVTSIPISGSVWVYAPAARPLILQNTGYIGSALP
jgi:hypothetical protein